MTMPMLYAVAGLVMLLCAALRLGFGAPWWITLSPIWILVLLSLSALAAFLWLVARSDL